VPESISEYCIRPTIETTKGTGSRADASEWDCDDLDDYYDDVLSGEEEADYDSTSDDGDGDNGEE